MSREPDHFAWHALPDGGAAVRWPASGRVSPGELANGVRDWLAAGVRYAQVFLPLPATPPTDALHAAGFRPLTTLELHRRPVAPADTAAPAPSGLALLPFDRLDPHLVKQTLARTYVGSLDGPELNALRLADAPPDDAPGGLALLAFRGPVPVGALVLESSDDGTVLELSYLGVVPEARRGGVATGLLGFALAHAARSARRAVLLSVDDRNAPAKALYERAGFACFERRAVWWWVNDRFP